MAAPAQPFNLNLLADGERLTRVIEEHYRTSVVALSKVGQGFYGHVYKVTLGSDPKVIIVKCQKYAGTSESEKKQLEALGQYAVVKVPEVYALHSQSEIFPCEALSMEYIPGIDASNVQFPDEQTQMRFVDLVVENLLTWHSVNNPAGFGELEGPYYETWLGHFRQRVANDHVLVHSDERKAAVSGYVMSVIDRSFEELERIFQGASKTSSLVHGDYNARNMMVDPTTFELTGIIDPIDAGWSDFEIDLFHLSNCRPDLGLLERYMQEIEVDEGFWKRYKFYRFWDDVKHYVRMGWYEESRFRGYAQELEIEMRGSLR